jgi:hypothetical protein
VRTKNLELDLTAFDRMEVVSGHKKQPNDPKVGNGCLDLDQAGSILFCLVEVVAVRNWFR